MLEFNLAVQAEGPGTHKQGGYTMGAISLSTGLTDMQRTEQRPALNTQSVGRGQRRPSASPQYFKGCATPSVRAQMLVSRSE